MNKKTLTLIIVMILVVIMGIILVRYIVNSKKTNAVNLKEVIEDINSIKDNDKIVNAKKRIIISINLLWQWLCWS